MNEEFDFEAFDQQWEAENADTLVEDEAIEETETVEEVGETTEVDHGEVVENEEMVETPDLSEEQKRNAAFAQLRRERDEAAKQASFLQKLAEENGMSVEDLVKRYEDARLEEQAETQNVPVEVLKRLKQLENENEAIKNQTFAERFNAQVESTVQKYNASEDDVKKTFEYAHANGLTDLLKNGATTFEAVHKMAHVDTLIERQVQTALQDSLSKKKKRQQEAPLSHGQGAAYVAPTLEEQAVADAKSILENGW